MFNFKMSKLRQQELVNNCNFSEEELFIFNNLVQNKKRKDIYLLTFEKFGLSQSTVKRRIRNIIKKISNCSLVNQYSYKVYIHKFPNGKKYVGVCQNVNERWCDGKGYIANKEMFADIKKYGWNNIEHKILIEVTDSYVAYSIEKILIEELDLKNKGYNKI